MGAENKGNNKELAQLSITINPEALRHVIASGQLMEFAATMAAESAAQIEAQIVQKVAEIAVEGKGLQGISMGASFIFEGGDFGTVPPRPRFGIGPRPGVRAESLLQRLAIEKISG